ncbi:hypothetical protein H1R20_g16439, partial [Candolleomyces eurysporus]
MKLSTSFITAALAFSSLASAAPQAEDIESRGIIPLTSPLLQATVSRHTLLAHARQFVEFSKQSGGTRAFGSRAHNSTVRYIKTLLDATGFYDTSLQTFPYLYSSGSAEIAANGTALASRWFTYGPSGDVSANLVVVNNLGCDASDYPAAVEGQIALIKRGSCEFGLKTALAGNAKAAGAIIYNNAPESIAGGTLGSPSREAGPYVPVGSISGADGDRLVADIAAGNTIAGTLKVNAVTEDRYTSNVIATTKIGDKNNIVFAGGHTDSVPEGPGINDDGSGTITILDLALRLPLFNFRNAVRFGFWTAEEFGLVGSEHYVTNLPAEEQDKIAVYLNFDMVASPNFGYFVYDGAGNLRSAPTEFSGRSDYGPFLDVGIPSGGLFTGAEGKKTAEEAQWWGGEAGVDYDICYHKACDGVNNLNVPAWVENTKAAAHAIATYARSLNGIPRGSRSANRKVSVASLSHEERQHYSCGHEIASL